MCITLFLATHWYPVRQQGLRGGMRIINDKNLVIVAK